MVRPDCLPCTVLLSPPHIPGLGIPHWLLVPRHLALSSGTGTLWIWLSSLPLLGEREPLAWVQPAPRLLLATRCQLSLLQRCCSQHRPGLLAEGGTALTDRPVDFIQPAKGDILGFWGQGSSSKESELKKEKVAFSRWI